MISITLLACAASALAYTELEYQSKFVDFMQKHQKSYQHEEFQQRYNTFKQNVDFIDAHTADPKYRYTVAMNAFGDLTAEEFKAIYNGVRYTHVETAEEDVVVPEELHHFDAPMPKSVDWRTKGCVTPVKNQGQCGSCWSFSTTGSTEAQHMLSGQGKLVGLSEQNLMDCSTSYGNKGCGGGLMDDAFKYIIANKGIDTEASYPYTAMNGPTCEYKEKNRGACIEKYTDVPSKNETALTIAVSKIGPVSVAIDAGESSFQFYSGGVYYSYFCSQTALDHGVLVVGYGVEGTEKFYWVKNSWGGLWGDNGYIKMIRDWDNNCGIATAASYPKAQAKC